MDWFRKKRDELLTNVFAALAFRNNLRNRENGKKFFDWNQIRRLL